MAQGAPAAPQTDDAPMALADYGQGDPNASDGLQAPTGSGTAAVAGAFKRGRQTKAQQ